MSLDEDFQADREMLPMEVADWSPNPEELYRVSELRQILIKTLEELPRILRTVFVLRDIEGLSIDQTAAALNLSHTAVKARLWRARLEDVYKRQTLRRLPPLQKAGKLLRRTLPSVGRLTWSLQNCS